MIPYTSISHERHCPAKIGKPGKCPCDESVRRFKVHVYDFGNIDVIAKSHSGAKYQVYLAMLDTNYVRDFHQFIATYSPRVRAVAWDSAYEVHI
jgi:hypothetical protein